MSNRGKMYVGTSGWNYKHWAGRFYPENLPQKEWLKFYTGKFTTVELNSSFYHLPKPQTFDNWRNAVPDDFLFSVKASRYITHIKRLNDPEESLNKFIDNAKLLKEKLGPILFQLPPGLRFEIKKLKDFLNVLPADFKYTFEFRDKSWWNEETYDLLTKFEASFCIFEIGGIITPDIVTSSFVYLRLHGPDEKYKGTYSENYLVKRAGQFSSWMKQGKEVYCYFDNDENAYAVNNALELKKLITA